MMMIGNMLTVGEKHYTVDSRLAQALADISSGQKKVIVPYRDSILTKLLQNALGGNRLVLCVLINYQCVIV